jgi:hypothetical protein
MSQVEGVQGCPPEPLERWRSVFFTDESRFQHNWADGRLHVWLCVGEGFADVNMVPISGVMVLAGISYGQ